MKTIRIKYIKKSIKHHKVGLLKGDGLDSIKIELFLFCFFSLVALRFLVFEVSSRLIY
jgi:hypothetical protein